MKKFNLKTFKKYLIRGLIGLGLIVAVLLITNSIFLYSSGKRLEQRMAAIRAAGDPVSFLQLAQAGIPPEQNAAVFLGRAQAGVDNISNELQEIYSQKGFSDGQLTPGDLKTIESALLGSPEVIPLLLQAADCTEYNPPIDYTVDDQTFIANVGTRTSCLRAVMRVLVARVHVLVSQGKQVEALQTCLTQFRLSRLFDREPTMIGCLVALACRSMGIHATNVVLRAGPQPESSYMALDAELARHDDIEAYIRTLKTERVLGIECFQSIRSNIAFFQSGFVNDQCDYLDLITEQIEFASRSYSEVAGADLIRRYKGRIGPLAQLVLPAVLQCRSAFDRVRAQMRCLRILNAIHRRAEAGDKSEPQLADLGIPAEATTDPFSDAPLKLKKTPAGWLVYSIGQNLQDDAGDLTDLKDFGVGPIIPNKSTDTK